MKNINIKNVSSDIEAIIKKDKRFLDDKGEIIKSELIEKVISLDEDLIKLLTKNHSTLSLYFTKVDTTLVFDRQKFLDFISSSEFLPKSYTAFENQIGLINENRKLLSNSREIVLNFPFKDCILEGGQDKGSDGRDEVFFNTILAPDEIDRLKEPKALVNFKKYTKDGPITLDKIDHEKDNLILRGNNLLALYSLLPKYRGKVKLIYIDPPYNTGSDDFKYNDKFNHSTWLVFMKNRLEVAKELLSQDGVIFVQCDDGEQAYLKVLMDEIFYSENFLSTIAYQRSGVAGLGQGGKFVVNVTEYINVFAKSFKDFTPYNLTSEVPLEFKHMKRYNAILKSVGTKTLFREFKSKSTGELVKIYKHKNFNIEKIPLANFEENKETITKIYKEFFDKVFRLNVPQEENSFQWDIINSFEDDELYSVEYLVSRGKSKGENVTNFYHKKQLFAWLKSSGDGDGEELTKVNKMSDFWTNEEIPKADLANEGGVTLGRGKKPEQLLKRIISISTKENDIVLDYHLGSGTTCAVAHKMGRRYIGIEQLNYGENDAIKRLENVINADPTGVSKYVKWSGGGSFVYAELLKNNQKFVEEIEKAKSDKDLKKIYKEMQEEAFFRYDIDIQRLKDKSTEKSFDELDFNSKKNVLLDCLDANHLYVNYSDIEDSIFKVDKKDVVLNKKFYE